MNKYTFTTAALTLLALGMTSCAMQEPPLYSSDDNGIYFDYGNTDDMERSINFGDYILNIDEETGMMTIPLNVKVVGHITDTDRPIILKSKPVEGYEPATVVIPDSVVKAGNSNATVNIRIAPPADSEVTEAACIYLATDDPRSDFGMGISGYMEMTLIVSNIITKPDDWDSYLSSYFGDFSDDKHVFLVRATGSNDYGVIDWSSGWYDTMAEYNKLAIDSLRSYYEANPDAELSFNIPFTTSVYDYSKPYYWGDDQDKYFGSYSISTFFAFATRGNTVWPPSLNSANEKAFFTDAPAERNKEYVELMGQLYNGYFLQGQWSNSFVYSFWVPMHPDEIDYELPEPEQWMNAATKTMVEEYYGAYSSEKYKFMVKVAKAEKDETSSQFILSEIFPVRYVSDEKDSGVPPAGEWEDEQLIRNYNLLFRNADAADTSVDFGFPLI